MEFEYLTACYWHILVRTEFTIQGIINCTLLLALRLEPRAYSPSLMLALEDQLVPYSLLRLCLQAYIPNGADPTRDPLLSPIHLSNEVEINLLWNGMENNFV